MTDISIDTLAPPKTVAMKGKMSARETMSTKNPSPEMELPNLVYGSVWLVSASDGDARHLSPLALHALAPPQLAAACEGWGSACSPSVSPSNSRTASMAMVPNEGKCEPVHRSGQEIGDKSSAENLMHRKKQMTNIATGTLAPPQTVAMKGKMSARETMSTKNPSPEMELPTLVYGSVWLVSAGDGDARHLSPLALYALGTTDAVIHDPGIPQAILDLVKPPRYREAAAPRRAIERAIKLAQDGWRVVHLVEGDTMERAVESAMRCNERNVPCRIVPNAGEPIGAEALPGFLLVRKMLSVGSTDPRSALVLVVANAHSDAAAEIAPRQRPLDFSMSGLAG